MTDMQDFEIESIVAENNERGLMLSEEVEFLDSIIMEAPADMAGRIMERRDIIADYLRNDEADPDEEVLEGTPLPEPEDV
jgi:hypothetical protein